MKRIFAILALLCVPMMAHADGPPPQMRVDALPSADRESIALSDASPANEQWEGMWGQVMVRNTVAPALYPVRPRAGKGNGQAVLIVPGGGYQFVSIDSEGFRVADRLAAEGYTAFVLKYRVMPTPVAVPEYIAAMSKLFGSLGKRTLPDHQPAIDDMAAAIAYIHANAAAFGIDPAQIGAIGFSAGSRTAIRVLETKAEGKLLANVALIYPPMDFVVKPGPRPPLFLAIAADDPLFKQGGLALPQAWLAESENMEFHLYANGNHGFGMRPMGTTSDDWFGQYVGWLAKR